MSRTACVLVLLILPLPAQAPTLTFTGTAVPGGTVTLTFQAAAGQVAFVALSPSERLEPLATPFGPLWLGQPAFTLFAGTLASRTWSASIALPADPRYIGAQLHAQGLTLQGGMAERARLTVRDPAVDPTLTIDCLVLNFDPIIESWNGRRLHDVLGWNDPRQLTRAYLDDLRRISGGFVDGRVVEYRDLDVWPPKVDGFRYTDQTYLAAWQTNSGWHVPDGLDYDWLIRTWQLDQRVQSGEIDEVLVFGAPYFGYYESRMAGPNAYWCNSPGMPHIRSGRLFVIMGFNYERGLAEMLHSYGHRTESILTRAYGSWNNAGAIRHDWDRFTRYDRIDPGNAACGNIHFPPNGQSDYDYGNGAFVWSTADDWRSNWPTLQGTRRRINAGEWGSTHLGFMRWWFGHLPRRPGQSAAGKQNNWWKYTQDFNAYSETR